MHLYRCLQFSTYWVTYILLYKTLQNRSKCGIIHVHALAYKTTQLCHGYAVKTSPWVSYTMRSHIMSGFKVIIDLTFVFLIISLSILSRWILKHFLIFPDNRLWHFMQIVSFWKQFAWNVKAYLLGQQNIVNVSSGEFAQIVVMV